jgi:hypothetical protein
VTFGNLVGSLFFGAVLVKCKNMAMFVVFFLKTHPPYPTDSGILSAEPYASYVKSFAM